MFYEWRLVNSFGKGSKLSKLFIFSSPLDRAVRHVVYAEFKRPSVIREGESMSFRTLHGFLPQRIPTPDGANHQSDLSPKPASFSRTWKMKCVQVVL
jgi:hypothetical protein